MTACTDELHLGDYGTELLFPITECKEINGIKTKVAVDIRTADPIEIRFKKEDETVLPVVGTIYTGGELGDGRDGIIEYITQVGDIDVLGKWQVQATLTFPSGEFNTNIDKTIKVLENI